MKEQKVDGLTPADGGPAFPQGIDQGASEAGFPIVEHTGGMTIRDYFAIRAPREVPNWFRPAVPELGPAPKRPQGEEYDAAIRLAVDEFTDNVEWPEDKKIVRAWSGKEYILTPEIKQAVEEWAAACKKYEEARAHHREQVEIQTMAQWPWAYAALVLRARSEVPHE